jgi:6-phosphogluconolactonase
MPQIKIYPDTEHMAHATAELLVTIAVSSIDDRGSFSVALSGGSTPRRAYEHLATKEFASRVDWSHIHVFWGDERCVPPRHPRSNYGMAREALLDHIPIPTRNVHRVLGELAPAEAASRYEATLRQFFSPEQEGEAVTFDLVLLGMGTDGHTASLFPRSKVLAERSRWVASDYVDETKDWRVTLTPPAINAARQVSFLVSGRAKARTVQQVIRGPRQSRLLPAQIVQPKSGNLTWLLDSEAAALV